MNKTVLGLLALGAFVGSVTTAMVMTMMRMRALKKSYRLGKDDAWASCFGEEGEFPPTNEEGMFTPPSFRDDSWVEDFRGTFEDVPLENEESFEEYVYSENEEVS